MRRSYIIRKHPVCANDDICLSVLDIYQIGLDLRRIDKARQQNHVDRETFAPLDKILVMLLGEQRLAAEQIAQNTERMAQMIERGATAAAESSASAEAVARLAVRLRESTLQFSV